MQENSDYTVKVYTSVRDALLSEKKQADKQISALIAT